jgi:hypothetical protein
MKNGKAKAIHSQEKAMRESFLNYGILSLTAIPNNDLMWSSYADCHEGFCVGFDTRIMFNFLKQIGCGGGQVLYYNELPIIYPLPKSRPEERHVLLIFSKLQEWEFEKEYRLFRFSVSSLTNDKRKVILPSDLYTEIIIGDKMPIQFAEELKNSIPEELRNITVKKENEIISPNY